MDLIDILNQHPCAEIAFGTSNSFVNQTMPGTTQQYVAHDAGETFIVLEYVDGESLAAMLRATRDAGERIPVEIGAAIVAGICRGLHAAHEARGPDGAPLGIVHRDVSPQNRQKPPAMPCTAALHSG